MSIDGLKITQIMVKAGAYSLGDKEKEDKTKAVSSVEKGVKETDLEQKEPALQTPTDSFPLEFFKYQFFLIFSLVFL